MSTDPTITLSSGHAMPRVGLGTSKLVEKQIADGIEAGARHLDCARMYGNEAAVGRAVRASKVPRSDFFLTSKLFMTELRRDAVGDLLFYQFRGSQPYSRHGVAARQRDGGVCGHGRAACY